MWHFNMVKIDLMDIEKLSKILSFVTYSHNKTHNCLRSMLTTSLHSLKWLQTIETRFIDKFGIYPPPKYLER